GSSALIRSGAATSTQNSEPAHPAPAEILYEHAHFQLASERPAGHNVSTLRKKSALMRVTTETKAQTRERILSRARKILSKKAFDAVTTRDLAAAADIGVGTFFNY